MCVLNATALKAPDGIGLLTLRCGRSTIRFMPALMIQKELVDEGLEIFEDALTETEKKQ